MKCAKDGVVAKLLSKKKAVPKQVCKISVDCTENDPVDVRCGGPFYLGYDFFVMEDAVTPTISFIKDELQKNSQPLICINVSSQPYSHEMKIWSPKEISECIKKGY